MYESLQSLSPQYFPLNCRNSVFPKREFSLWEQRVVSSNLTAPTNENADQTELFAPSEKLAGVAFEGGEKFRPATQSIPGIYRAQSPTPLLLHTSSAFCTRAIAQPRPCLRHGLGIRPSSPEKLVGSVFKRAQTGVCGCFPASGEYTLRACFGLLCKPEEHSRERITSRERGCNSSALLGTLGTVAFNQYGADALDAERGLTPLLDVFKVSEELSPEACEVGRPAIRFVKEIAALLSGGRIWEEEGKECVGAMGKYLLRWSMDVAPECRALRPLEKLDPTA